jgi:flagellar assembly protein FliH
MNMSFSAEHSDLHRVPVTALVYFDMAEKAISEASRSGGSAHLGADDRPREQTSEEEIAERISRARAEAIQQTEHRLRQEYEQKLLAERGPIAGAVAAFEEQRNEYFSRAEAEIVQLAMSIAAKILHREAQVDPMLVAALVKITMDKMHEGSSMTVRVSPSRTKSWTQYFATQSKAGRVTVVEDATLTEQDCMLETELGIANFGLDTQLKEIERGFFDLLALRPESR